MDTYFTGFSNLESTTSPGFLRIIIPIPAIAANAPMPTLDTNFVMEGGANIFTIGYQCRDAVDGTGRNLPTLVQPPVMVPPAPATRHNFNVISEYAARTTPPAAVNIGFLGSDAAPSGNVNDVNTTTVNNVVITNFLLPYTSATNANYRIIITPSVVGAVIGNAAYPAANLIIVIGYNGAH